MQITQPQNDAVGDIVEAVVTVIGKGSREIDTTDAISSTARLAGSFLFRSFGHPLPGASPGSVVLSGEMMLWHLGWVEAADLILKGLNGAIASKRVTYDFARLMEGATEIRCSEFGDNMIAHM